MPKDLKTVALVAAGVIVAGYVMYTFRDVQVISDTRDGFGA